jgi:hypothetical protein
VSGTWTACRTATADVSGSSAAGLLLFPNGPPGCHAGRTPTIPTHLDAAVACDRSGTGPVSGCAAHELPCPRGYHRTITCPYGWSAAERWPDIRPEHQIAADAQHGQRHQHGYACRTQPARTAVVPEAADGQSADRSDSLQLPLLFLKAGLRAAASGGRPRPAG